MLHQPVRAGGLALAYALATSTLVLVTFLVSNLVLSTLGGIGRVAADPATPEADPPAAVLLSSERDDKAEKRCPRGDRQERRGECRPRP